METRLTHPNTKAVTTEGIVSPHAIIIPIINHDRAKYTIWITIGILLGL